MYAKKDGDRFWLYFDTVKEAEAQYKEEEKHLWEILGAATGWRIVQYSLGFFGPADRYRRKLTDEFEIRESFKVGDPVCWCGENGKVIVSSCEIIVCFTGGNNTVIFTFDGKYLSWHKAPSLFHGHDVLRPEDQKFPVVHKPKEPKELPSQEVGKCIPHWLDNYKYALAGEWDNVRIGSKDCYLCQKYMCDGGRCQKCPIAKDTGEPSCCFTAYNNVRDDFDDYEGGLTEDRNPAYIRDVVLYLLDLQKRLEEKERRDKRDSNLYKELVAMEPRDCSST